jgi:hypothetical protein
MSVRSYKHPENISAKELGVEYDEAVTVIV